MSRLFDPSAKGFCAQDALALGHCADVAYLGSATSIGAGIAQGMAPAGADVRMFQWQNIQAYAARTDESIVVAFRGTEPNVLRDWYTDFDARLDTCPLGDGAGRVHDGFWRGVDGIWPALRAQLAAWSGSPALPIWLCGHSLGGALALVAALRLQTDAALVGRLAGVYTYGQPRVGDAAFASFANSLLGPRYFRFVNDLDIVPHVPPAMVSDYRHAGVLVYFDKDGSADINPSPLAEMIDDIASEAKALAKIDPAAQITDHLMKDYLPLLERAAVGATAAA